MDTEEQQRAKGHPTENLENSATGGQQPLNENETINPTEVVETMEVHKHPQSCITNQNHGKNIC